MHILQIENSSSLPGYLGRRIALRVADFKNHLVAGCLVQLGSFPAKLRVVSVDRDNPYGFANVSFVLDGDDTHAFIPMRVLERGTIEIIEHPIDNELVPNLEDPSRR